MMPLLFSFFCQNIPLASFTGPPSCLFMIYKYIIPGKNIRQTIRTFLEQGIAFATHNKVIFRRHF